MRIVEAGGLPPLVECLHSDEEMVLREAARAVGNLSANCDFGRVFFKLGVVPLLLRMARSDDVASQRMGCFALSNVATNVRNQAAMIDQGVIDPLVEIIKRGLDPAAAGDSEAERYALLALSNLCATPENHARVMEAALDHMIAYTKGADLRSRHHAVYALGNLASQQAHADAMVERGVVHAGVSFAFPGDLNA